MAFEESMPVIANERVMLTWIGEGEGDLGTQ